MIFPGLSTKRMIEREVILFPEPDSPTNPTVLPLGRLKVTPSTALTSCSSVKKDVLKSFTSSMLSIELDSVTIYFHTFQSIIYNTVVFAFLFNSNQFVY